MKKILTYKGYLATVEFDSEDMLLIGQVIGLSDSLYFHASSTTEIEAIFHQCVDNYLEFCTQCGKTPEKSYKGSFNVRVSPDLHRRSDFEATRRDISLNQFITLALEHELDGPQKETVYVMPQPIIEAMLNTGPHQLTSFQPAVASTTSKKGVSDIWKAVLS